MPIKWMRKMGRKMAKRPASHRPKRGRKRTPKSILTEKLIKRQRGLCPICYKTLRLRDANIDHKVPKALGGRDHVSNYQATHIACNSEKADCFTFKKNDIRR